MVLSKRKNTCALMLIPSTAGTIGLTFGLLLARAYSDLADSDCTKALPTWAERIV